ncbi:N6-adenosine-specific RNA methylase IME4 [Mesorhizobium loti]|uniref:N6-adenosine-specific RNA methylase IME4 n=1 Tax=Rhizobium loti TaxID=381 RepID=A0A8E2WAM4_RHILI|nr:MT-A70 family methyltransferase [Mesorhizobium loti]PWJ88408.1 N6-adenosine-specific RNA methylase IME4 [Mesorhizobium loti]
MIRTQTIGDASPVSSLVRYDAACMALASAKSIDEVKDFHDKAEAMRAYARQAKNHQMEVDAAEIRIRAERRLGELIVAQKTTIGLNPGGRPKTSASRGQVPEQPTLSDVGVDRKMSARAQKMAAVPEGEFEAMVGDWRNRIEIENERVTVNLLKAGEKRMSRDQREAELAASQRALPTQKFGLILADPEWRFEPYSRETGMDRAADNHYPTSSLDAIMARDVASIAADDCILFLWATAPMLIEAICVLDAWGFAVLERDAEVGNLRPVKTDARYVTSFAWLKERIITGYWNRGKHEILLVATRGNPVAPDMYDPKLPSWFEGEAIMAPSGEHSAKPELFLDWIDKLWPNTPKIELNRRGPARPNWSAWGLEAELPPHDPETGEIIEGDQP